ncbi:MAG: hypothetical protein BGN88_12530 [Clostridiales bacterium 43-6]|nr:MAG: hypothetical protein BGN88_12530 [Clostridiales bacterium 43-6]
MRRSNREVTDPDELISILTRSEVCRLGFTDGDYPYIVPMNFGFTMAEDKLTLFFHCAGQGKKLTLLKSNNRVCFETDINHSLVTAETACDFTMAFESIIGFGTIGIVEDPEEKMNAFRIIMKQYGGENLPFNEKMVAATTVLRLDCESFTGKRLEK